MLRQSSTPANPTTFATAVGADPILGVFADGTDGFYFDFSKTDRLFQDTTGQTPADDPGESVGLALEGHGWGGKTLSQLIALQPEVVTNGDFSGGSTGWTLNDWTIVNGKAVSGTGNLRQFRRGGPTRPIRAALIWISLAGP